MLSKIDPALSTAGSFFTTVSISSFYFKVIMKHGFFHMMIPNDPESTVRCQCSNTFFGAEKLKSWTHEEKRKRKVTKKGKKSES